MKIGENEYEFEYDKIYSTDVWGIEKADLAMALNELADLRAEVERLRGEIREAVGYVKVSGMNCDIMSIKADMSVWLNRNEVETKVIVDGQRTSESKSERFYNPFLPPEAGKQ